MIRLKAIAVTYCALNSRAPNDRCRISGRISPFSWLLKPFHRSRFSSFSIQFFILMKCAIEISRPPIEHKVAEKNSYTAICDRLIFWQTNRCHVNWEVGEEGNSIAIAHVHAALAIIVVIEWCLTNELNGNCSLTDVACGPSKDWT